MKPSNEGLKKFINLVHSSSIDYNKDRNGISFSANSANTISDILQASSNNKIGGEFLTIDDILLRIHSSQKTVTPGDSSLTYQNKTNGTNPLEIISKPSTTNTSTNTNSAELSDNNLNSSTTNTNHSFNDAILNFWSDTSKKIATFEASLSTNKREIKNSKITSNKLMQLLTKQQNKLDDFDSLIFDAESRLNSNVKSFEDEIINARNSILAVIALFASFFTFISISVNIFSKDMQLSTALSIILLLWSCTLSFIFVFMAGISKGGEYFTSKSFLKHCASMLFLFIFSFIAPKVLLALVGIT